MSESSLLFDSTDLISNDLTDPLNIFLTKACPVQLCQAQTLLNQPISNEQDLCFAARFREDGHGECMVQWVSNSHEGQMVPGVVGLLCCSDKSEVGLLNIIKVDIAGKVVG